MALWHCLSHCSVDSLNLKKPLEPLRGEYLIASILCYQQVIIQLLTWTLCEQVLWLLYDTICVQNKILNDCITYARINLYLVIEKNPNCYCNTQWQTNAEQNKYHVVESEWNNCITLEHNTAIITTRHLHLLRKKWTELSVKVKSNYRQLQDMFWGFECQLSEASSFQKYKSYGWMHLYNDIKTMQ